MLCVDSMQVCEDFLSTAPAACAEEIECIQNGAVSLGESGLRWIAQPCHSFANDECIPRGWVCELRADAPMNNLLDSKTGFGTACVSVRVEESDIDRVCHEARNRLQKLNEICLDPHKAVCPSIHEAQDDIEWDPFLDRRGSFVGLYRGINHDERGYRTHCLWMCCQAGCGPGAQELRALSLKAGHLKFREFISCGQYLRVLALARRNRGRLISAAAEALGVRVRNILDSGAKVSGKKLAVPDFDAASVSAYMQFGKVVVANGAYTNPEGIFATTTTPLSGAVIYKGSGVLENAYGNSAPAYTGRVRVDRNASLSAGHSRLHAIQRSFTWGGGKEPRVFTDTYRPRDRLWKARVEPALGLHAWDACELDPVAVRVAAAV